MEQLPNMETSGPIANIPDSKIESVKTSGRIGPMSRGSNPRRVRFLVDAVVCAMNQMLKRRSAVMRMQALFVALLFALPTFGQTQFLVPADNLVIEGIPAIPASITEEVRRYTESRGASLSSWHPVKRDADWHSLW